ncbi:alpha/beta fold hydrolase [Agitococcus lubricus]|uniref:Pimeloyl-ACP methyl ester carboxylesterase n=1 Tax=Agitococcus lubricus TaxID=1077255 RepID=A0A2T5IVX1_9GAMM|nr:alpha/beta hydrolase [Agitococcus lubricus]PTQ87989.1 pimeloyl-ACP methyl ester carboxylesterase [Agitococcus lubricus]
MPKPILHFAHANGIPSACYRKLLNELARDYQVVTLPLLGTDPRYPIDAHWSHLIEQVTDSILRQSDGRQVYVLGHSLGAMTSYMAAHKYPDLFKGLVMLDPPLINGLGAYLLHAAKLLGLDENMTPAAKSKNRREVWPSRTEAAASLRHKALFKTFDAECFADYIQYGLTDCPEGVRLTIPAATEVAIFRHTPSNPWRYRHRLKVPAAIVVGKESHFAKTGCPERLAKQQPVKLIYTDGGHMFPLEHPLATAALVRKTFIELAS